MGYFPEGSQAGFRSRVTPLKAACEQLPPNVKQAFYAAASKGAIARRTWDGCAFNAGSLEVLTDLDESLTPHQNGVRSFGTSAQVFGISESTVKRFITAWDAYKPQASNEAATHDLMEILDEIGLTTPVGNKTSKARVVTGYVYKSSATKFKEQLENVTCLTDIPGLTDEILSETAKVLCSV